MFLCQCKLLGEVLGEIENFIISWIVNILNSIFSAKGKIFFFFFYYNFKNSINIKIFRLLKYSLHLSQTFTFWLYIFQYGSI